MATELCRGHKVTTRGTITAMVGKAVRLNISAGVKDEKDSFVETFFFCSSDPLFFP